MHLDLEHPEDEILVKEIAQGPDPRLPYVVEYVPALLADAVDRHPAFRMLVLQVPRQVRFGLIEHAVRVIYRQQTVHRPYARPLPTSRIPGTACQPWCSREEQFCRYAEQFHAGIYRRAVIAVGFGLQEWENNARQDQERQESSAREALRNLANQPVQSDHSPDTQTAILAESRQQP